MRCPSGDAVAVEAFLCYDTKDPLVVTLSFLRGEIEPIDWVLGRDLLIGGTALSVGDGDVRIHPGEDDPGLVWLRLDAPAGRAVLTGCRRQLTEFLDCTVALVPFGEETAWLEIDASITRFFAEDRDDFPES
ncbi:sporulation and cell division regulator protein [Amycolatopsis regifaucium]|uniref:Sporulation and cell division regulator protein n=1 Tax=Amycolatopsis regifaucium TaxID=546365 RepID=A0ABX3DJ83_9PSEU|nr:sporulation and cell division regulator protein [Amycolatopsis regifaucium]